MKKKIALICTTHTILLVGLPSLASAQTMEEDERAGAALQATSPQPPQSTLTINPLGIALPELRLLYERSIFNGTGGLVLGASVGSRYYFWGIQGGYIAFIPPTRRARIGRVHVQARKYWGDDRPFQGIYVAGEGNISYRQDHIIVPDFESGGSTAVTVNAINPIGTIFGGWKYIADSGLTLDLSLGGGLALSGLTATLFLEPRLAMGWSF